MTFKIGDHVRIKENDPDIIGIMSGTLIGEHGGNRDYWAVEMDNEYIIPRDMGVHNCNNLVKSGKGLWIREAELEHFNPKFKIGDIVKTPDSSVIGVVRGYRILISNIEGYTNYVEVIKGKFSWLEPHNCDGYLPKGNGYKIADEHLVLVKRDSNVVTIKQVNIKSIIFKTRKHENKS